MPFGSSDNTYTENNSYFYLLIQWDRHSCLSAWKADKSVCPTESSGDHTQVVTPVPIPNTAVKHLGPMVVRKARE